VSALSKRPRIAIEIEVVLHADQSNLAEDEVLVVEKGGDYSTYVVPKSQLIFYHLVKEE